MALEPPARPIPRQYVTLPAPLQNMTMHVLHCLPRACAQIPNHVYARNFTVACPLVLKLSDSRVNRRYLGGSEVLETHKVPARGYHLRSDRAVVMIDHDGEVTVFPARRTERAADHRVLDDLGHAILTSRDAGTNVLSGS